MKKAILAIGMILVSSSAFAGMQKVDLMAGSSVRLNVNQATIVTCEGGSSSQNSGITCDVKKHENYSGYYYVMKANEVLELSGSLDGALQTVAKLRNAGICN